MGVLEKFVLTSGLTYLLKISFLRRFGDNIANSSSSGVSTCVLMAIFNSSPGSSENWFRLQILEKSGQSCVEDERHYEWIPWRIISWLLLQRAHSSSRTKPMLTMLLLGGPIGDYHFGSACRNCAGQFRNDVLYWMK